MNEKISDELFEKYLAAETTLEEEKTFFSSIKQHSEIEEWAKYVRQKRKKVPSNINDSILTTINKKEKKRKKFLVGVTGIAASIVFPIVIFIGNTVTQNNSYHEKEILLNEALLMFSDEKYSPLTRNIIYEDDTIIIYTE